MIIFSWIVFMSPVIALLQQQHSYLDMHFSSFILWGEEAHNDQAIKQESRIHFRGNDIPWLWTRFVVHEGLRRDSSWLTISLGESLFLSCLSFGCFSSDLSLSFDIENKNLRNWETETTTVTNGLFTLEDRTSSWQSVLLQEEYLVMFSHHHHLVFQIRDCEEAGSFSTNAISKWHSLTPEGLLISSPSLIVL